MTLAERLTAIKAEHLAAREEAEAFKRMAESRLSALAEVGRGVEEAAMEIAALRERADAASERACELAEQIGEIQIGLDEAAMLGRADLRGQIHTIRQKLRTLEAGPARTSLEREAEEQALLRQLNSVRVEMLGERAESLALEYLASARQLVLAAAELKAFADFAGVFGVKLGLDVEDLRIPSPQGDRPGFRARRAEELRVGSADIQSAKSLITAQWSDVLSD